MAAQFTFNPLTDFSSTKELSEARAQIERDWGIEFKNGADLKTHRAQEEAELLMDRAMKIIEAGDIDYALEVITMAKELKDASLYHAHKAAAAAYMKEARNASNTLPFVSEELDKMLKDAETCYARAKEEQTINSSISLYLKAMKLSKDIIAACQ